MVPGAAVSPVCMLTVRWIPSFMDTAYNQFAGIKKIFSSDPFLVFSHPRFNPMEVC